MGHRSKVHSSSRLANIRHISLPIATVFSLAVLVVGCGSGTSAQPIAPANQFINFDASGAGQSSRQGTFGICIGDTGDVGGYFIDSNYTLHGFIRNSSGAITVVDAPGAGAGQNLGTDLFGINSSGEAVGSFFDANKIEHSFVRNASGGITVFDPPGAFGSGAQSINDSGTVAGRFIDANGAHGYIRAADGTFSTFDPTGAPVGINVVVPYGINGAGFVAGTYTDTSGVHHGFLLDPKGTLTILDAPGAGMGTGEGTEISGINSGGVIVGGINVGIVSDVNTSHSFIRAADGTYTMFDPPQAGGVSSYAYAINDSGVIVGTFRDASLVRRGYVRQSNGTFVVLNDPDAAQLQYTYTNLGTVSFGINSVGSVVGVFTDLAAVRHGFIWQ